ncbi:MAG: YidC/Oxa1 family membrane protein insertase [Clostridia bacterium]|nr:YidC/Oxa1 family membrane protein insertase [Clostridia bacterium]
MRIPVISDIFGWLFKLLHSLGGGYLLTLLLFAIVVKILLLPFGIKQQKNSIKQAKMRPKEMAIRRKYAGRDDQKTKQKMSEEIMQLYQEENINPMGGCLPLLIQMPILFSLYDVIRNPLTYVLGYSKDVVASLCEKVGFATKTVDQIKLVDELVKFNSDLGVDGVSIEAVKNLKDSFYFFGVDLTKIPSEHWGIYILIPVLTFVFAYFSTKIIRRFTYQPQMSDASTKTSMGIMDFMMPLMSVYISVILSSAIGVYWMFQNVLSALQQIFLYKLYPIPVVTEEQIKQAELQLKGKSGKKKDVVKADYEIDDYDKTTQTDKSGNNKKPSERNFTNKKSGINPKVKEIIKRNGKPLKARRKI